MSYGKITDKQSQILEYIKSEILNKNIFPLFQSKLPVKQKNNKKTLLIIIHFL